MLIGFVVFIVALFIGAQNMKTPPGPSASAQTPPASVQVADRK